MAADQPSQKQGKTTAPPTTGATSPNNATKRPKERVPNKSELTEINQALMCSLCSGYLIDATAIIECQHTFCKSCILKYLETNGYCPICDIELNTVKPHLSLRSDVILQRLVYKLVPGLLVSELRLRKDHAEEKENIVKAAESVSNTMALEVDAASDLSTILSLDDVVSLSIEYFRGTPVGKDETTPVNVNVNVKPKPASLKQEKLSTSSATNVHQTIEDVNCSNDANDRRYLKCPSAVSVGLLKKFIRMKYGLSDDYRVDLLYNGVRDNSLESELTLLDVAWIFKWNKDEPMRFQYQIFDRTVKSLSTRAGSKRSASSMMDEPPDDDATSGPHNNRPPMTSAAPSSKIPRVSNNSSTTGANNNSGRTGGSSRTTTASHTHTAASSTSPSTPVYDFSNSDTEEPIQPMQHKGKLKLRGFRRETSNTTTHNVIESSSSKSSQGSKRSPSSHKRSSVEGRRRSSGSGSASGKSPARSNSVGTTGSDDHSEDADSDSSSSDESDGAKTAELTNSRVRSAAQTVMAAQVNGSIKLSMSSEKREPLKLSLGSVLAKSPEHKHKHKHHHKMKHKKKHKPLKISLSLNPSGSTAGGSNNRGNVNQSQNNHTKPTGAGVAVKVEGKGPKLIFGLGQNKTMEGGKVGGNGPTGSTNSQSNFPVNVKPTTSAHLSNMSKSISVSIGVGNNSQKTGNNTNVTAAAANQLAKKILNSTTTTLVPKKKNSGIEIQPTTLPAQNTNSSSNSNQSTVSSARSHPLLPDSVHVPKSVTLIPVNPSGGGGSSNASTTTTTSSAVGRGGGSISSGNVMEKSGSAGSTTSNRLNAHTFTHPITNKSLHQITVHSVPPPPKSGSSSPASGSGSANNSGNNSNISSNAPSSSPSSNPIEKVIANAANKPQFNGPGSMEITKIYCNSKENPTKKLKERKGLDISITVPGINIKDKNKTTKLEETLRQKMGLHNTNNSSSNPTNTTMNSKIKGNNGPTLGPHFNVGCNAKMPPGITIGPAGVNKQQSISGSVGSTTSGNTTIPGLGFTLPPHITAHPQHPVGSASAKQLVVNQMKQQPHQHQGGDSKSSTMTSKGGKNVQIGGGNKTKDLPISCIGTGTAAPKGNQATKAYENRKQLGEALASMIDMANRNALKSPSPPKNSQQVKDHHHQHKTSTSTTAGVKLNQMGAGGNNLSCEKRVLDMSSSSSRKNSRESPEPKRSKTNESSSSSTPKSSTNESPLDLSGTGRPNSRPNSNSSSPINHQNVKTTHSHHSSSSFPIHHEKVMKHNEPLQSSGGKKCPTPVPKISPPNNVLTTPTGFPSPSGKSSGKGSTPTGTSPSILSIAQNLAQKQLNQQQQQQKEQFLHNQIMHLQQGLQNMHAANSLSHSHSHHQPGKGGGSSGVSLLGNSLSPKGSHAPLLNSLSPPIMTMPNPSSPAGATGFDPLRNLLTLSDAAVAARHGKVHPMNSLMAAVGLCPPHTHHPGLSLPSPTSVTSASLFPHLANSLGGGKSAGGMLDAGSAHAYLAAISAHNERLAAAAGMGHFHGDSSMSPPMSMPPNPFFSPQVRPNSPHGLHGSLRIPSAPSSSSSTPSSKAGGGGSTNSSNQGKNNIKQLGSPPLSFPQHPTPPAPRSPNKTLNSSSSSTTPVSSSSHSNKSHHDSSISSNMKTTRINGTTPSFSGHLPIFPPGIHNPILPTYSRSVTTTNCSNSTSTQNPISSSTSFSTGKVTTASDKKGTIPNSMKISNFLPSKPKDGKGQPDNSHAEATITSGSIVGGGTSLAKFLNSIPPLIVSQQSNLSVSSSTSATLPKEHASSTNTSSRGLTGIGSNNKSSNEQECRSKSLDSKSISPSSSMLHNPIKIEPSENKPIISGNSNSIPLKSTLADPITCQTVAGSPPKQTGLKLNEEKAANKSHHSSSSEIKSEGATTLMSTSSSSKVGIFSLGSPPAGRTSTTTNQAVRHIPNPALLFNRQNSSSSSSTTAQSPITSPTNPNEFGKSLPLSQKSPLKSEEHGLAVGPSLPFPGVSFPVQVKVDNDAVPIPIPTPRPTVVQQLGNYNPQISEPTAISPKASTSTAGGTVDNLLISQSPNKEIHNPVTSQLSTTALPNLEETTNQICKTEEIVKIEYTEDADLDIDVGIESAPILFHSSGNDNEVESSTILSHQNDDEKVEQNAPSTCSGTEVGVGEVLSSSEQIEGIPSSSAVLSPTEIKTEATSCSLDLNNGQVDTTKAHPSPSVTSQDAEAINAVEAQSTPAPNITPIEVLIEESETISVDAEKTEDPLLQVSPNLPGETASVEPTLPEILVVEEKTRQIETENKEGVKKQVETGLGATETETPMELQEEENQEVESGAVETEDLVEGGKEEEKSGEIPAAGVETSEVVTTQPTNQGEIPSNSDKSAELQIESMECEEAPQVVEEGNDHRMEAELEEQDHEVVPMSVDEEKDVDLKENVNLHQIQEPADEPTILNQTTKEEELHVAIIIKEPAEAPEILVGIQVAQELSCSPATTSAQEVTVCDTDQVVEESRNEDDLLASSPALLIHTSNSDSQIQTKDLKSEESESNFILNQITINPEALQVADMDIMTEPANDEPVVVELSFEEEASLTDNKPSNNTDAIPVKENEGEEKLTESSSTSQLELNCPSADPNGIELSNPVTLATESDALDVHTAEEIFPTVPIGHVQLEETKVEELDKSEKCKNVQTAELTSPTESNVELETLHFGVEESCPVPEVDSVVPEVEEVAISSNNDSQIEILLDHPMVNVEFDPQLTIPVLGPSSILSLAEQTFYGDDDVEMIDDNLQIVTESPPPMSSPTPQYPTFPSLTEDSIVSNNPSLISATATITTTTAEISSNVMSSSMDSSISSRNSLESPTSPTSPEDNLKKMESLEQVAAGLFASAANTMNNNNNKTINAPSCEIAITTTSANDMATV